MYDIIIVGSGIAGASCAYKTSKFAKTLLIDATTNINSFPVKVNLFIEHNRPFVEDMGIDWNNKEIFPRPHDKIKFLGDKVNGYIESSEFGKPYGYIVNTHNFLKWVVQKYQDNEGTVEFNKTVTKINRIGNGVEVIAGGQTYKGKVILLATGSNAFHLQTSLGFQAPDRYMGVYTNLVGDPERIERNIDTTYTFNVNTKISKSGPFFINKGTDMISTGYLGDFNETVEEIINKLERILKKYDKLQPMVKDLQMREKPKVVAISKHPIKQFSQDRALILGEAAGLVTAFFYEGIVCGLSCADIAAKILKPLFEKGSSFTQHELIAYDEEVKRLLLSAFFRNGHASEYMFYSSPSSMKVLWDTYLELINENKTLRQFIYEVHFLQDLSKYDVGRDRWAGERIFGKLPMVSKIALGPKFLKAMFKL